MKARSVKFLTASGLKNIWSHRLMSIASVGVLVACMLMMGIAVVLTFNIDNVVSTLEDQNVVLVFFDDEMSEEDQASGGRQCKKRRFHLQKRGT